MSGFRVQATVSPYRTTFHDTEVEAVAAAEARVGPRCPHVVIETITGSMSSFALKHFKLADDGSVSVSDWRCWVAGIFVGGRTELGELVPA